jgi:hypothetical protein
VVPGHHAAPDLGLLQHLDHAGCVGAQGVGQDGEAQKLEGHGRLELLLVAAGQGGGGQAAGIAAGEG